MEEDVEIIWRAFELRPKPVPSLDPNGEYMQTVWNSSVYPLSEKLGIKMKLPPIQPRSRSAHEAAKWAETQGKFDEYNAALFRAFFEHGEDIGEIETLLSLASDLKLETEFLRKALETNEFLERVLADERDAAEMGMSGVPAFVADRKTALTGVQPFENLKKLIESVRD
jgi:predicted DsbA family dithiol-disulfide isomerase